MRPGSRRRRLPRRARSGGGKQQQGVGLVLRGVSQGVLRTATTLWGSNDVLAAIIAYPISPSVSTNGPRSNARGSCRPKSSLSCRPRSSLSFPETRTKNVWVQKCLAGKHKCYTCKPPEKCTDGRQVLATQQAVEGGGESTLRLLSTLLSVEHYLLFGLVSQWIPRVEHAFPQPAESPSHHHAPACSCPSAPPSIWENVVPLTFATMVVGSIASMVAFLKELLKEPPLRVMLEANEWSP